MARDLGSWLSGLGSVSGAGTSRYRGERLGLPETGPGSAAPTWRRLLALFIDWLIADGLALLILRGNAMSEMLSSAVLIVWFAMGALAVWFWRFTPGQYLTGLQVAPADGTHTIGLGRAVVRNLLLALIVPPLITDIDGRGLQDRATRTVVVRSR